MRSLHNFSCGAILYLKRRLFRNKRKMAYKHNVATHKRRVRSRRLVRVLLVILAFFVLAISYIFFDWVRSNLRNSTSTGNSSDATVRSASINIFRTPYFQFQADKSWRAINEFNTENKRYVYRSYENILVQHEIIIEVDSVNREVLSNTQVAHVLPVEIVNNKLLSVGAISPHCKTLIEDKNDRKQRFISYKETEFPCDPDSSVFLTVAGLVGGNEVISRKTDTGEERSYKITYRDSTFSPSGRPLINIINSFQLL